MGHHWGSKLQTAHQSSNLEFSYFLFWNFEEEEEEEKSARTQSLPRLWLQLELLYYTYSRYNRVLAPFRAGCFIHLSWRTHKHKKLAPRAAYAEMLPSGGTRARFGFFCLVLRCLLYG